MANRKKGNRRRRLERKRMAPFLVAATNALEPFIPFISGVAKLLTEKDRIWLAAFKDDQAVYRIKRYAGGLDAAKNRDGAEVFSTPIRDLAFDYIYHKRYSKDPALIDRKLSEMGFLETLLREEYEQYCADLERDESEPLSATSSEQFAHL